MTDRLKDPRWTVGEEGLPSLSAGDQRQPYTTPALPPPGLSWCSLCGGLKPAHEHQGEGRP